jgi:hypothetical protein
MLSALVLRIVTCIVFKIINFTCIITNMLKRVFYVYIYIYIYTYKKKHRAKF